MFFKYKSEKETKVEVSHGGEGFYTLGLKDVEPVRCTFPSGGNQSCWTGSRGLGRPRGGCLLESWEPREVCLRGCHLETGVFLLNLRHAVKGSRIC